MSHLQAGIKEATVISSSSLRLLTLAPLVTPRKRKDKDGTGRDGADAEYSRAEEGK